MKNHLRTLWRRITGTSLPHCHACQRRTLDVHASVMTAPTEQPVDRCYPSCQREEQPGA
ncbi:hypothetical protein J7I98_23720 [Streptomyces sp. ISL-98]|uniref:hypothetical protein n=1 Tax=Streptomyces sp. ISL-98 TaxID=2819192 RepID=UPI001BEBDC41|nr:hypothetical protein [Streptomyces sp. ISL-98]MBT2508840.1 hypothetical protein [Streptomyces sp. ISL-98]